MPLVNVIRGQEIPEAPLNLRTPVVRIPLWMALAWWCLRGLGRLLRGYVRYWWVTMPATGLGWLYLEHGWLPLAATISGVALVATVWAFSHRPSWLRLGWWPIKAQIRRWQYRRVWHPAMATARLAVSWDTRTVLPVLRRVRCGAGVDRVVVRMVSGQTPDDFALSAVRLAHTFGVRQVKVTPGRRPDTITLNLLRGDPLTAVVPPVPVPYVPDFASLPLGRREDGRLLTLKLFGTQVLVAGATDAGKGSVIWSIVRALASGIRDGIVEVWAFDPKGGMELAIGRPLFARFACDDYEAMADVLEEAVARMRRRTARLRGKTRQHIPTVDEPLILIIIDELAALTAYLTDRQLKERIKNALGILLSQGRAVGVHALACLQDPRKEILPFRNLFPTRIALRLTEDKEVDLVLNDGSRDRGALCDQIPKSLPGVAYVLLDGDPTPMRVRFSYHSDADIRALAADYGRLRLREGSAA
ncbi:cell division protein FtsK [Asanoa sp. NPDC049573]|uniref:cell division protein FtsK n=1 Tax=Asanoa sp. NPDC049573 TaxID=3155396 RepID=UPI00341DA973